MNVTEYHLMQKLKSPPFELSKKEKRLQEYLLENLSRITRLNIVALERDAGVSKSTISRFCRRLGVASFRDFATILTHETAVNYSNIHITAQAGEPVSEIARNLYALECETLRQTFSALDYGAIKRAAEAMLHSKVVHLFSSGGAGAIAMDFYHKLLRLGMRVMYQQDLVQQKMQAEIIQEGEAAFVFTLSGEDCSMLDIAAAAKRNGAFLAGVTNGFHSHLAKLADVCLCGANREEFTYTGTIESRLSLMYVVDLLFILTSMQGAPATTDMLNRTKSVLDDTKRGLRNAPDTKGNANE